MNSSEESQTLRTAIDYVTRGIGVVPLHCMLSDNGNGKLSPIPLLRWHQEGPLRTSEEVTRFWQQYPEAQLAILLSNGLVALDIDLKHLPSGLPPDGLAIPSPPPGGYVESTKGGGLHYLFWIREPLPEGRSHRIIQLGGYVDILADGILVVAPSRFRNAAVGYQVKKAGGIPIYRTITEALKVCSGWMPEALEERWHKSLQAGTPTYPRQALGTATMPSVDGRELLKAMEFVSSSPRARRIFSEGCLHQDGKVDHSRTEWNLSLILKKRGFSMEVTWAIVCLCPHTKSPLDRRGVRYFAAQVWARVGMSIHSSPGKEPGAAPGHDGGLSECSCP